jgi:hypothetical protein
LDNSKLSALEHQPTVLLFTGHLIDSAGRQNDRFPYELQKDIQKYLKSEIDNIIKTCKPNRAISSLAAGGDMIFAQEMLDRKIPLTIFLPFEMERFLSFSVTYVKGIPHEEPEQWARRFHRIIQQAKEIIVTGKSTDLPEDAFALCNAEMLSYALAMAGDDPLKILALALIKSDDEIRTGGTSEFVKLMQKHHILIRRLWPRTSMN